MVPPPPPAPPGRRGDGHAASPSASTTAASDDVLPLRRGLEARELPELPDVAGRPGPALTPRGLPSRELLPLRSGDAGRAKGDASRSAGLLGRDGESP